MVSVDFIDQQIQNNVSVEYVTTKPLDIFDSSRCQALATQAIAHRHLKVNADLMSQSSAAQEAIPIILVEDNYPGWLRLEDLQHLEPTENQYYPQDIHRDAIVQALPDVIRYAKEAMAIPNEYLWGGTIGPNLDCSGLVQRAYGSQGIWVPRDAYQQEAFTEALTIDLTAPESLDQVLQGGDLVFFGTPQKATHVAIYLGDGDYIHSSGKDRGRNGIGIDSLTHLDHPVSQAYVEQYRGVGRVVRSFCP